MQSNNHPLSKTHKVINTGELLYKGALKLYRLDSTNKKKEAFKLFNQAADMGHLKAKAYLGICYIQGTNIKKIIVIGEDILKKMRPALEKLTSTNDTEALFILGWMHDNGHGVEQNYEKAFTYYQRSANLGSGASKNAIGCMYKAHRIKDIDIITSDVKAMDWFMRAVTENGNRDAKINMGVMYQERRGGIADQNKSDIEAIKWFKDAEEKNSSLTATRHLIHMDEQGRFKKDTQSWWLEAITGDERQRRAISYIYNDKDKDKDIDENNWLENTLPYWPYLEIDFSLDIRF